MSGKWLQLLVVLIFVLHLAPTPTLAKRTDSDNGRDLSLHDRGSSVGQPDTINGNEGKTDATVVLALDTGSKSEIMLPRIRSRRAATPNANNTSTSLVQSIVNAPLNMINDLTNWILGMIGNLAGAMMIEAWKVAKNSIIPELDKASMRIITSEHVPEGMKNTIISVHSTYTFMKLFGYMKPE